MQLKHVRRFGLTAMLSAGSLLHGQPDDDGRFTARLVENRYGLSVRDGQFSGTGAAVLRSSIAKAGFVLVGEEHGLAETSQFWIGVCNAACPNGFHTMALEEGPLVAAELERWAVPRDAEAQVAAFEKRYPESIQIYNTREEVAMLHRCAATVSPGNFRLWGLNQEAPGASGLILSRILDTRPPGKSGAAMRELAEKNDSAYAKALQTGRISDLFMLSADDKDLAAGAALLEEDGTPEARSLFAALIQSHEINRAWPADSSRRSRLMETLFAAQYAEAARSEPSPRVLLKFGAYHVFRGLNPLRESGLGNYVADFANRHGEESLHIYVMPVKGSEPVYPKLGQPARLIRFNRKDDPRSRYLQPVLANMLQSDWTMYDLRPLREVANTVSNSDLATLVFGIDILMMVPEGTPSTRIR